MLSHVECHVIPKILKLASQTLPTFVQSIQVCSWNSACKIIPAKFYMQNYTCKIIPAKLYLQNYTCKNSFFLRFSNICTWNASQTFPFSSRLAGWVPTIGNVWNFCEKSTAGCRLALASYFWIIRRQFFSKILDLGPTHIQPKYVLNKLKISMCAKRSYGSKHEGPVDEDI